MSFCIKREVLPENKEKPKIPRPPNAFMLYANENRKKMSQMFPTECNKDISKRLGNGWKALNDEERKKFFEKAKAIGLQHKKEYPDYVYNPKEARIRKAMRDATRERSIGASPMLPRPNARRASHNWTPHDDIMMSQLGVMRPSLEPPVCSGFPGTNQFMTGMNGGGYTKLDPPPPPPPPPIPSSNTSIHSNYMQTNPLAQLQQHTEMWHDYPTMRPRSSGNPFMMPEVSSYHSQAAAELTNNILVEKAAAGQTGLQGASPPQTSNVDSTVQSPATTTSNEISEKTHSVDFVEEKLVLDGSSVSQDSSQEHYLPMFETNTAATSPNDSRYDRMDEQSKLLKQTQSQIRKNTKKSLSSSLSTTNNPITNNIKNKPLPDFNEAFGSTERGRFQSIPDPRLAPNNKGYVDYFFDNNPIKFDNY